jgi:isoleucyl-tRNA synthetase
MVHLNGKNDLRKKALTEIKKVHDTHMGRGAHIPNDSKAADGDIKQRAWGVPITVLYCKDCGR